MQIGCFRYEWQKNAIRNTLSPFSRANHWKKYHLKIAHIAINGNYYSYINQAIWYAISYSFILSPKQQQKRKLCWSHSIIRIQIKKTQFRTYLPLLHYVSISRTCNSVRIFHAFTTYPSQEPAIPYVSSTPSLRIHLKNLQSRTYFPRLHYVSISRTCNSVRIFT